ncbi:MAG: TIGR01459 family HAD-type hydrolase [Rhizobiaceae bacterium]|nr:TIGR01459 family HAD-type hydrolase [Rhizobiaceae bacterium]
MESAGAPVLVTFVRSLEDLSDRYAVIFCDVWGVIHNGVAGFGDALSALSLAHDKGIAVVLITNAPRPASGVSAQIDGLGIATVWDRIVTSGDVTRDLIRNGPRRQFHLGPERDLPIFDGLDVDLVEEREASVVVCTGLYDDENDDPSDYAEQLRRMRSRDLPMICANPDIVAERGHRLVWCAGALARDYGLMGGRTLIAGKPHRPIYDAAMEAAAATLGRPVERGEVLAIGDGMMTDVKGAADYGIDVLYVSAGIHAADYGDPDAPDADLLAAFLSKHGHTPVAVIPRLR